MGTSNWLILLSDEHDDIRRLIAPLDKFKLGDKSFDGAVLTVADAHCTMRVALDNGRHVVGESVEMAESFPHPDAARIAACRSRLDLSCALSEAGEATNRLAVIEQAAGAVSPKCWFFDPQFGWL